MATKEWHGGVDKVSVNKVARLVLDIGMTVLLLLGFAYQITGNASHEWIGTAAFASFGLHTFIHRRWYKGLVTGSYPMQRSLTIVVNCLLGGVMLTLLLSGLLLSREVLPILHASDDLLMRKIHASAAYWGMLFLSIHVGLHWELVAKIGDHVLGIFGIPPLPQLLLRVLRILIMTGGIIAAIDRDLWAKLFAGTAFDFWNPARPMIIFFAVYIVIMGSFVCLAHYGIQAMRSRNSWRTAVEAHQHKSNRNQ